MLTKIPIYILVTYIASFALTMLTIKSWLRYRHNQNRQGAIRLLLLFTLWAICMSLWLTADNATLRLILLKLSLLSTGLMPVEWIAFVREFVRQPRLRPLRKWQLLILPLVTQAIIWSNATHQLFWRDESFAALTPWWATPAEVYGPWFWVHAAYSCLLFIIGAVTVLGIARSSTHRYQQQAWAILIGVLIVLGTNALILFAGISPQHTIRTNILAASGLLLFVSGIFHYQWIEQLAFRDREYGMLQKAVLILDAHEHIADINHLAELLLKIPTSEAIGEKAEHLLIPWTLWAPLLRTAAEQHTEIVIDRGQSTQWLEVHTHPRVKAHPKTPITVLTLLDITERKWAEQALEARQRELTELNALSRAIASSLSLNEVLQGTVNAVMRLFPQASDASVQLLDAQKIQLRTRSYATKRERTYPGLHFDMGKGIAGLAAERKATLNIPDILEEPRYIRQKGIALYRSMLVTPLLFGAEVLGTLSIVAPPPHAFSQSEANLLEDLARFASIAVQNANLYEQAQAEIAERKLAVTRMHKNEILYRALFEQTTDAIFIIGLDGRYITANQRAAAMLGYSLEELLTRHPNDIIIPEEQADAQQRLKSLRTGETLPIYERRFRCRDGSILNTEISIVLIHDPDGAPLHIQSIVRDITQRKADEEALRQSEEKHRLLLDSIQSPVLALDHDMRVLYCNTAYADYISMTIDALAGQNLKALFPNFATTRTYQSYQRCLETGKPQVIEGWSGNFYFKARIYPTPWGLLAIADNVTEQKNAQDTLQRYTERLQVLHEIDRAILEARSPEAIAQTALQQIRRLIPCQRSLIIEFGSGERGALLAAEYDPTLFTPAQAEAALAERCLLSQEQLVLIEDLETVTPRLPIHAVLHAEGIRSCLWAPLTVREQPVGTLCLEATQAHAFQEEHIEIAREVAASLAIAIQQAQLNEQTQQDAAIKTSLIDKINHRVKNNLASIIGLIFMAQRHLDASAQDVCAPALERLANQIHTLSAVHQMLSSAEWQMLPLSSLAEQVVKASLQAIAPQARISVTVTPSNIKTDSKQANGLALILHELTTNTVKHGVGERGAAQITIHVEPESPGPWGAAAGVRLEFRDDGPGYDIVALESGEQHMGLYLVQRLITINLRGTVTFYNAGGAVADLRFAIPEQNNIYTVE
ncbi:MAG: PAS domain S-box protein [Anaerolineae bacterium]|nr:PAS domain S-box protein [Anaerolineae bacterium]